MNPFFRVWVSRRFWPWPKRYRCKGMEWCAPERNGVPQGVLLLMLLDERRVWVETTGRIITYGREFHEWQVEQVNQEAGQKIA